MAKLRQTCKSKTFPRHDQPLASRYLTKRSSAWHESTRLTIPAEEEKRHGDFLYAVTSGQITASAVLAGVRLMIWFICIRQRGLAYLIIVQLLFCMFFVGSCFTLGCPVRSQSLTLVPNTTFPVHPTTSRSWIPRLTPVTSSNYDPPRSFPGFSWVTLLRVGTFRYHLLGISTAVYAHPPFEMGT